MLGFHNEASLGISQPPGSPIFSSSFCCFFPPIVSDTQRISLSGEPPTFPRELGCRSPHRCRRFRYSLHSDMLGVVETAQALLEPQCTLGRLSKALPGQDRREPPGMVQFGTCPLHISPFESGTNQPGTNS